MKKRFKGFNNRHRSQNDKSILNNPLSFLGGFYFLRRKRLFMILKPVRDESESFGGYVTNLDDVSFIEKINS